MLQAIYLMETMEAAQVLLAMTGEETLDVVSFVAEEDVLM